MIGKCEKCPGTDHAEALLRNAPALQSDEADGLQVQQWVKGTRCRLEALVLTQEDFCDRLLDMLRQIKVNHFASKQQARYLRELKTGLKSKNEAIVLLDFAENYSFIVQDAPQSYHWVNDQASIHPVVIYFRPDESGADISVRSFAVISDCLQHDTTAVSAFQAEVLKIVKQDMPEIKKIYYFSDGASSQYKNKQKFVNLCYHQLDYNIEAEWNFFATSHGKSACDGVGGTLKRLAAKASLQRPYQDQIMTPYQLFLWASNNIKGIRVLWVPASIVEEKASQLAQRFSSAVTAKGTRNFHCFKPLSLSTLCVGLISYSATKDIKVSKE
ncbi:unnamed protein product [Ixodes hexagonus]